jgi:hypothetical protein
MLLCKQVVKQCGTHTTEVQTTGWAWRETNTNFRIGHGAKILGFRIFHSCLFLSVFKKALPFRMFDFGFIFLGFRICFLCELANETR